MISKISSYVGAGLDESLRTFSLHLLASVFVAAANYAWRHVTGGVAEYIVNYGPLFFGFPVVTSFFRWLTTTAKTDQAVGALPSASSFAAGTPGVDATE